MWLLHNICPRFEQPEILSSYLVKSSHHGAVVVRLPGRHEVVRSNPGCCVTFLAENIPVLSGRLVAM